MPSSSDTETSNSTSSLLNPPQSYEEEKLRAFQSFTYPFGDKAGSTSILRKFTKSISEAKSDMGSEEARRKRGLDLNARKRDSLAEKRESERLDEAVRKFEAGWFDGSLGKFVSGC